MQLSHFTLVLWLLLSSSTTVSSHLRHSFGTDWTEAERYVDTHQQKWKQTFRDFEVDASMAQAIVFPELIRYSKWQDKIEQAANSAFYISGGMEQANFSIGRFQMKPSFAEDVEREWNSSSLATEYGFVFNLQDNATARRSRINRLSTQEGQCRYLSIFLRLQYLKYPALKQKTAIQQVRYLATAYNYSHTASSQDIEKRQHQRTFHTDIIKTASTHMYCYADIAVEYYKSHSKAN